MNSVQDMDDHWTHIANLTPQLRPHLRHFRHHYRGQPWYVLMDELCASHFRLPEQAYRFVSLLDGNRTVAEAYALLWQCDGSNTASHNDVINLLTQLHRANLLRADIPLDKQQTSGQSNKVPSGFWQRLRNPLAQRFALLDPDRFLQSLLPWVKALFSPAGLVVWLMVVIWAAVEAGQHGSALAEHWATRFTDPVNLMSLWLIYPLVKVLHELAHGLATRLWGGEVHEMGIMLLVFMPLPYVDATASNSFVSKHRRMVVAGAGIMAELWLAAIALLAWMQLDAGWLKDCCFNIAVIGSVSTLLFNGNPLLRFDGYYLLMDLLEIPNLASRANHYLAYLGKRYVLGFQSVDSPVHCDGERRWLLSYGISAGLYRLGLSLAIAIYVAGQFFIVGVVLALWMLIAVWILPGCKAARRLFEQAQRQQQWVRLYTVLAVVLFSVYALLFIMPVTDSSYAEGVIKPPEQSIVRAATDGFISDVFIQDGQSVSRGQPLFELANDSLLAQQRQLLARFDEISARHQQALLHDRIAAEQHAGTKRLLQQQLAQLQRQITELRLLSPMQGMVSITTVQDLPGRYVRQGDPLAYVLDPQSIIATVVVNQADVEQVRRNTRRVEVKLANQPWETWPARIVREVPLASNRLPSRSLGSQGGGSVAVDASDQQGIQALESVFSVDIALQGLPSSHVMGHRLYVRFIHDRTPLAMQWLYSIRHFFLTQFEI